MDETISRRHRVEPELAGDRPAVEYDLDVPLGPVRRELEQIVEPVPVEQGRPPRCGRGQMDRLPIPMVGHESLDAHRRDQGGKVHAWGR